MTKKQQPKVIQAVRHAQGVLDDVAALLEADRDRETSAQGRRGLQRACDLLAGIDPVAPAPWGDAPPAGETRAAARLVRARLTPEFIALGEKVRRADDDRNGADRLAWRYLANVVFRLRLLRIGCPGHRPGEAAGGQGGEDAMTEGNAKAQKTPAADCRPPDG